MKRQEKKKKRQISKEGLVYNSGVKLRENPPNESLDTVEWTGHRRLEEGIQRVKPNRREKS